MKSNHNYETSDNLSLCITDCSVEDLKQMCLNLADENANLKAELDKYAIYYANGEKVQVGDKFTCDGEKDAPFGIFPARKRDGISFVRGSWGFFAPISAHIASFNPLSEIKVIRWEDNRMRNVERAVE
jgi:hypothetical protein